MDSFAMLAIVASFATLVTTHVALSFGLIFRLRAWEVVLAFVVFPLAPYFGFTKQLTVRSVLWCAAALAYGAARAAALLWTP